MEGALCLCLSLFVCVSVSVSMLVYLSVEKDEHMAGWMDGWMEREINELKDVPLCV